MAEEPVNFEEELKRVTAERDAYATKLDEYITENNRLSAELKVQQAVNRKTVGASDVPPKDNTEPKKSLTEAFADFKANANKTK